MINRKDDLGWWYRGTPSQETIRPTARSSERTSVLIQDAVSAVGVPGEGREACPDFEGSHLYQAAYGDQRDSSTFFTTCALVEKNNSPGQVCNFLRINLALQFAKTMGVFPWRFPYQNAKSTSYRDTTRTLTQESLPPWTEQLSWLRRCHIRLRLDNWRWINGWITTMLSVKRCWSGFLDTVDVKDKDWYNKHAHIDRCRYYL